MRIVPVSIVLFFRDVTSDSFKLWMQERTEDGPLKGLWEFPGGKIEVGESPLGAALREVKEETGLSYKGKLAPFLIHPYEFNEKKIVLNVFWGELPTGLDHFGRWFERKIGSDSKDLKGLIPEVNHQIVDKIVKDLETYNQDWKEVFDYA